MKRKYILLIILVMLVGFVAVATKLYINGAIAIGADDSFDGKSVEFVTGNLIK